MVDTTSVFTELNDLFKLEPESGENQQDFIKRIAIRANSIKDADWETLSEPAQRWVNDALGAVEDKKELPLPDGIEALSFDASAAMPEVEVGDPPVAPASKKKKAPAKPAAKKAAKATPAKKAASAKAPVKAKAVKVPIKAAKAAAAARGPKGKFSITSKIKILTDQNPYRKETKGYAWFAKYKAGMLVETAIKTGVPRYQIRFDVNHKHITVA